MANQATKSPTTAPSPKSRPGLTLGQAQEFTLICPLKPGGAQRMRELFREGFDAARKEHTDRIGTVHDLRFVIFDNDSRVIFASTFDGTWDSYIDDFGTRIPDEIDLLFHECEGYPGIHSPQIKDWIVSRQVSAMAFYSAYPEASVRDVWKALKTQKALEALLDQAYGGVPNLEAYTAMLEVSDIQATVLRPRPSPYRGEYVILRVDDAAQGREMIRRMIPHVAPADECGCLRSLAGWVSHSPMRD